MRTIALLIAAATLTACQVQEKQTTSLRTQELLADSVESAVTATSGALDDASGASMVAQSSWVKNLLIGDAQAACSRTLTHNGSGQCARNVNCDFGAYLWSGSVQLNFANGSTCSLTGTGDSFERLPEFSRTGPRGTIQTTSATRTAWDGVNLGGGMTVTQMDAGGTVEMEIAGVHKILTRTGGQVVMDVSLSTSQALSMNQLARNGRIIQSGTLSVRHNRARFTAEHSYSNVSYSSSCCYPTAGTITSTLSGSLNGTATFTFQGCGTVEVSFNGQSQTHTLANCE